jgi:hypothetical protein
MIYSTIVRETGGRQDKMGASVKAGCTIVAVAIQGRDPPFSAYLCQALFDVRPTPLVFDAQSFSSSHPDQLSAGYLDR